MEIQLTDVYRIVTDRYNFTLEQRREKKDKPGEHVWAFLGHYSGLRGALHALPDHVALTEPLRNAQAFSERLEAIADEVAKRLLK